MILKYVINTIDVPMNKILTLLAASFMTGLACWGQTADPVLMRIQGKPVLRSEFEYSYNKNGNIEGAVEKKSVDEYVDMFVNYKLKVAAAEALRLDTLQSFKNEFMQYRDMQLLPHLVDTAYVDSIAFDLYQRTARQLEGKDMLRLQHILVFVKQGDSESCQECIKAENRFHLFASAAR